LCRATLPVGFTGRNLSHDSWLWLRNAIGKGRHTNCICSWLFVFAAISLSIQGNQLTVKHEKDDAGTWFLCQKGKGHESWSQATQAAEKTTPNPATLFKQLVRLESNEAEESSSAGAAEVAKLRAQLGIKTTPAPQPEAHHGRDAAIWKQINRLDGERDSDPDYEEQRSRLVAQLSNHHLAPPSAGTFRSAKQRSGLTANEWKRLVREERQD